MKMTKKAMLVAITMMMSESLVANNYEVMDNAMYLGVSSFNTGEETVQAYDFGYYWMSGESFRYGLGMNFGAINGDDTTNSELVGDMHIRLGYAVLNNLDVIGTVGYGAQTFGAGVTSASGIAYGAAVHYGISNNLGVLVDYKKYDLSHDFIDLNYDPSSVGLKLNLSF